MLDAKKNRGIPQPYLANVNVRWGSFDLEDLPLMRFEESENERYGLKFGDIVVCEGGEPGRCAIWKDQVPNMKIQKALHRVRCHENVDYRFLYYYLLWAGQKGLFDQYCTGSTIKHLPGEKLKLLPISLPPPAEQRRIAEILGALDDKIELNSAINRNLEEQARALFKNWFIDFAPFGGNMPGDWRKGTLSEIAEFEKDKVDVSELTASSYYSTENMLPNKAGVCPAANLPNVSQTTRCYPGETIISNIRPYFKKILFCTEELAGCSTDVLCFKPRKASLAIYNYCLLCQDDFFNYVLKGAKGTKMPRGDKSQMMKYGVCIPPEEVLQKFASIAAPMLRLVDKNRKENRSLVEFRDTLLPKLMNGEN